MKVLVIDNYDSFTYNLVYILRKNCDSVTVFRNDKIEPKECLNYDGIVLSPGPGIPKDAGGLKEIISICAGKVPLFGVCLGHQAIAEYLGGTLRMLDQVYHGVASEMTVVNPQDTLFIDIPKRFIAGRYHSWDVHPNVSKDIEVNALADDGSIMGLKNESLKMYGIQFHPESILSPDGETIIQNFLRICKAVKS